MPYRLYSGSSCWVITPDCLHPPITTDVYGPLECVGQIDAEQLDVANRAYVQRAIERALYAVLPNELAESLQPRPVPSGQVGHGFLTAA